MCAEKFPNARRRIVGIRLVAFCLLSISILVSGRVWSADPPPGWSAVSSGGQVGLDNGVYRLHATVGQPAIVGLGQNSSYRLSSGFWHPVAAPDTPIEPDHWVYLPLVLRK